MTQATQTATATRPRHPTVPAQRIALARQHLRQIIDESPPDRDAAELLYDVLQLLAVTRFDEPTQANQLANQAALEFSRASQGLDVNREHMSTLLRNAIAALSE